MSSHAVYSKLDPDYPATLSPIIITKLLRDKLAFDGLILTDDLEMGAIIRHYGLADSAAEAFQAGVDILLICEDQNRVKEALKELKNRILKQIIPFNRFLESYDRIKKAKNKYFSRSAKIDLEKIETYFSRGK
jgi:beta-N-acetylhexosaminidase